MVAMNQIQELVGEIAKKYQPHQIILFGSHATGKAHDHSDVDLMVVMPDGGDPLQTAAEISRNISSNLPVEIIVRDPADLQRRLAERDWFLIDLMKTGKVLHAADHR
jgi:predicted nucleotidyltransferase